MDRLMKKKSSQASEWSRNGSYLCRPGGGWIHPEQQLNPDAGICYGVRYIGNIEVKESMKTLDFETRTQVTREAINRLAETAGLKTAVKRRKVDRRVMRMLGDIPNMQNAGANINLTVTTESINLMIMETGEIIGDHPMHVVSFASGGDSESLDFVGYVAKDPALGRACHVLECGGGLAEDVVTTVGQAFELRFKQYLKNKPKAVHIPDRHESSRFESEKWGDEADYYNDRPGACPPSPQPDRPAPPIPPVPQYKSPSRVPLSLVESDEEDMYAVARQRTMKWRDVPDNEITRRPYDNAKPRRSEDDHPSTRGNLYNNQSDMTRQDSRGDSSMEFDPIDFGDIDCGAAASGKTDLRKNPGSPTKKPRAPVFEEWFHGKISRNQAENLLELDGDFVVRESVNKSTQFVLSGRHNGHNSHLLLVDPDGVVRTKDFIFDSVSHLVNYHRQNDLPIITGGSELRLVRPIKAYSSPM